MVLPSHLFRFVGYPHLYVCLPPLYTRFTHAPLLPATFYYLPFIYCPRALYAPLPLPLLLPLPFTHTFPTPLPTPPLPTPPQPPPYPSSPPVLPVPAPFPARPRYLAIVPRCPVRSTRHLYPTLRLVSATPPATYLRLAYLHTPPAVRPPFKFPSSHLPFSSSFVFRFSMVRAFPARSPAVPRPVPVPSPPHPARLPFARRAARRAAAAPAAAAARAACRRLLPAAAVPLPFCPATPVLLIFAFCRTCHCPALFTHHPAPFPVRSRAAPARRAPRPAPRAPRAAPPQPRTTAHHAAPRTRRRRLPPMAVPPPATTPPHHHHPAAAPPPSRRHHAAFHRSCRRRRSCPPSHASTMVISWFSWFFRSSHCFCLLPAPAAHLLPPDLLVMLCSSACRLLP